MPNQTTSGAISGASSGAAAGTSILPGWGTAIGGLAGGLLGAYGGMAGDHAANRSKQLRHMRESAQRQTAQMEMEANAQAQERLRQLAAQRYASYGTLSQQLGGPERTAAGNQAGVDFQTRLGAAMGGVNMAPVGNRALVGGAGSDTAINAQLDPVLAARRNAVMQSRVQGGLQNYDTRAFSQQQNTSTDISRQANEEAQRQNALAAVRSQMLAQAGVKYADHGTTNGENNQMMLSQMGLAGMHLAGGLYATNRENKQDATRYAAQYLSQNPSSGGYATYGSP